MWNHLLGHRCEEPLKHLYFKSVISGFRICSQALTGLFGSLCLLSRLLFVVDSDSPLLSCSRFAPSLLEWETALCLRSEQFASLLRKAVPQKNLRYSICHRWVSPVGARVSYLMKLPACGQFCEIAPLASLSLCFPFHYCNAAAKEIMKNCNN